jgi:hypothetical protein
MALTGQQRECHHGIDVVKQFSAIAVVEDQT